MKKILLTFLILTSLVFILAVSVSAATPDANGETFKLSDGTVLPIWDTDGNGLIWYKSTANTEDGFANYDCVANNQKDKSKTPYVTYNQAKYNRSVGGINYIGYQLNNFTVTDANGSYTSNSGNGIVVINLQGKLYDENNAFNMFTKTTFKGNNVLEAVYLEKGDYHMILDNSFENCSALRHINLGDTQTVEIAAAAFNGCTSLAVIDLPQTLRVIGSYCFQNTAVVEIAIPESVVVFSGDSHFRDCTRLERVTGYKRLFDDGIVTGVYKCTFFNCVSLESLDMPTSNCTSIGQDAFRGCGEFTDRFVLPSSVTSIGNSAFQGSYFKVIVLNDNESLTMGSNVFRESYLEQVYISENLSVVSSEAFRAMKGKVVVYYTGASAEELKEKTVNNYNGVIVDASTVCVSANSFNYETRDKTKNYLVYAYSACDAFYNGVHNDVEAVTYAGGFDQNGLYTLSCSVCNRVEESSELKPIIAVLGYSMAEYKADRLMITSGYSVDVEMVQLYDRVNDVIIEIGVLFSSASMVADSKPTNLTGFNYYSDHAEKTYATYNYTVTFPSPETDNDHYVAYSKLKFVVSAFINLEGEYYYYQSNEYAVATLDSGFTATNISTIYEAEKQ